MPCFVFLFLHALAESQRQLSLPLVQKGDYWPSCSIYNTVFSKKISFQTSAVKFKFTGTANPGSLTEENLSQNPWAKADAN